MIKCHINLAYYKWSADIIIVINKVNNEVLLDSLSNAHILYGGAYNLIKSANSNKLNEGFTYTNYNYRKSVVYIGKASSIAEYGDTFVHELRHLQQHIANYYNIPDNSEEAAYLIGDIAKRIIQSLTK